MNQVEQGLRRGIGSWGNPPESFLASPTHFHMYVISLLGFGDINERAYGFLFTGYLPTLLALTAAVLLFVRRGRRVDRGARPAQFLPALQLALLAAALWSVVRLYGVFSHAATTSAAASARMVRARPGDRQPWPDPAAGLSHARPIRCRGPADARWPSPSRRRLRSRCSACFDRAVNAADGMHARYFTNSDWSGFPAMPPSIRSPRRRCSTTAGTAGCRTRSASAGPATSRWARPATYEFATTSDDGTRLTINDQRVVSNEGSHSPVTQSGTIQLPAGSHRFVLDYVQYGGPYALEWTWADSSGTHHPVPAWRLSQQRTTIATAIAARAARRHLVGLSGGGARRPLCGGCMRTGRGCARLSPGGAAARGTTPRLSTCCSRCSVSVWRSGRPTACGPYVYSWPGFNFIRATAAFHGAGSARHRRARRARLRSAHQPPLSRQAADRSVRGRRC